MLRFKNLNRQKLNRIHELEASLTFHEELLEQQLISIFSINQRIEESKRPAGHESTFQLRLCLHTAKIRRNGLQSLVNQHKTQINKLRESLFSS